MKKLFYVLLSLSLVLSASVTQNASAQIVKTQTAYSTAGVIKTSLSATDTAIALTGVITDEYVSVELAGTKTSGTVGGSVIFQGKNLDGSWVGLDTLAIANSAGLQKSGTIAIPKPLIYSDYRVFILSTGGVWAPAVYTCRRSK